jgi:hypothetical protein
LLPNDRLHKISYSHCRGILRPRTSARKADQGGKFLDSVTLSFEDPQRMLTVPVVSPKLARMKKIILRSK